MAVLAPVLERNVNTNESVPAKQSSDIIMTADERHNSRIKVNYARLINPDATVNDVIHKEMPVRQEPVIEQKPYLVENARADSDIFRADSKINQRSAEAEPLQTDEEEEENEDLRPSQTTIQYKKGAASKRIVDDNVASKKQKLSKLTKRDIIIMVSALFVVAALFVLVIVNSAVLSELSSDVNTLEAGLAAAKNSFVEAFDAKQAYFDEQNILQLVTDYAAKMGMSKNIGR